LDDIQIIDDAQHPLIAITTSLRQESSKRDRKED